MAFDRSALIEACRRNGLVARVVVAAVRGSAPRETGTAMLVWQDGLSGTIGGGALELEAIRAARTLTTPGLRRDTAHPLGPDLGQCCGGAVDLLTETFDLASAEALPEDLILRGPGEMPLAVARLQAQMRGQGVRPQPQKIEGWMVEPVHLPDRHVWIWGAGHVGRALISVLAPIPDLQITWVDTADTRFPDEMPDGVARVVAARPEVLAARAPKEAEHFILTYSHAIDLALCHALLVRGFRFCGLIGSDTKRARFRKRLGKLGHSAEAIDQITCPIGEPSLGKHPQAIALGVAVALLRRQGRASTALKGHG